MSPTRKQAAVLRYVRGYQEAHGFTPSIREIGAGIGNRSLGAVYALVKECQTKRMIRRLVKRSRAIELSVEVSIPRAPDGTPLYFVAVK